MRSRPTGSCRDFAARGSGAIFWPISLSIACGLRGVWKFLSKTVGTFDFTLREPKKNDTSVLATDKGPVLFPKLYRRFTSWSARHKAKVINMPFQTFLAGGVGGKPDDVLLSS